MCARVYDLDLDTTGRTFDLIKTFASIAVPAIVALVAGNTAYGQFGAGDWMTAGFDAQRSSWIRSDGKISLESMGKPGFGLFWKLKLSDRPQSNSITPPVLLDFYIGYRGFRALGFFGGSSDHVYAVDIDLGRLEWEKSYSSSAGASAAKPCSSAVPAQVTRPTVIEYPSSLFARGFGRGTPAKSGVGLPDEGSVVLQALAASPPMPRRPLARGPGAPNPFAPHIQYVLALTNDGKLHSLWVSNGEEPDAGVPFIPPNAHAEGLIAYDGVAYVSTTQGCSGVEDGVWAIDLTTKQVNHWKSAAGGAAGTAGPAVRPDGTLYAVGGGGELVALAAHDLHVLGSYKADGTTYSSSPVVFDLNGKDLVAVATADGRLHLLDAGLKGPALDRSEPFSNSGAAIGSVSSWRDQAGIHWLLAPVSGAPAAGAGFSPSNGDVKNGAIVAWKVVEEHGKPVLRPGWVSRDLISPLPPIIVNGVVFAVSSGEFRPKDAAVSDKERAKQSTPAVLYALDAISGKELWNSGATITSFAHSGALSGGGTRVYVSSQDGTSYAFGFPVEH